ncbi:MAG: tyrosine-type recombinase/integrase [Firmicutes bacterium]|nr:tyrosine-type recombinase/integrase [Bacillota bacterium]
MLKNYYLQKGEYTNFLLLSFGFNTGMRISDILNLRAEDVFDFNEKIIKDHICIKEKKTGKLNSIRINSALNKDIKTYFRHCTKFIGKFLFESNRKNSPISRIQEYRIIKKATTECKINGVIGCHPLRKIFGCFAWKSGAQPVPPRLGLCVIASP